MATRHKKPTKKIGKVEFFTDLDHRELPETIFSEKDLIKLPAIDPKKQKGAEGNGGQGTNYSSNKKKQESDKNQKKRRASVEVSSSYQNNDGTVKHTRSQKMRMKVIKTHKKELKEVREKKLLDVDTFLTKATNYLDNLERYGGDQGTSSSKIFLDKRSEKALNLVTRDQILRGVTRNYEKFKSAYSSTVYKNPDKLIQRGNKLLASMSKNKQFFLSKGTRRRQKTTHSDFDLAKKNPGTRMLYRSSLPTNKSRNSRRRPLGEERYAKPKTKFLGFGDESTELANLVEKERVQRRNSIEYHGKDSQRHAREKDDLLKQLEQKMRDLDNGVFEANKAELEEQEKHEEKTLRELLFPEGEQKKERRVKIYERSYNVPKKGKGGKGAAKPKAPVKKKNEDMLSRKMYHVYTEKYEDKILDLGVKQNIRRRLWDEIMTEFYKKNTEKKRRAVKSASDGENMANQNGAGGVGAPREVKIEDKIEKLKMEIIPDESNKKIEKSKIEGLIIISSCFFECFSFNLAFFLF